jgi:hypothetical protein
MNPPNIAAQREDPWKSLLEILSGKMTRGTFDSVFAHTTAELKPGGELIVYAKSEASYRWLKNRWHRVITETARNYLDQGVTVSFALDHQEMVGVNSKCHPTYDEIVRPGWVEVHTWYFRMKWRRLLGPVASELIRELRQLCYWNGRQDWVITTYADLAKAIGVSELTIKRLLAKDKCGKFKNAHLDKFILSITPIKQRQNGQLRGLGSKFVIRLDDPLTPEDEAKCLKVSN